MTRIATLIALMSLASPAAAQTMAQRLSQAPALKREAIVSTEIVRIGDLVDNAGAAADVPIFRAPDLGQTGSVPADRVIEAVAPHHIIGLDTRGLGEVIVTRASRAITQKDIEARIVRALAGQYGLPDGKNLTLAFDNGMRTLQVESSATAELAVARLAYDPRSGRFDVSFTLPGSAEARRLPMRFTGSLIETFDAAVPVRPFAQGEVLKVSDIAIERRPKAELAAGGVLTAEQAQGLAARRPLRAGQVLRQGDLMKPELVGRNETVTIVYEVPGIVLSIRGKALEAGALGDVINVLNEQSKRTIQATIIAPGRVTITALSPRLAANVPLASPPTSERNRAE